MNNANAPKIISTPPFEVAVVQFALTPPPSQKTAADALDVRVALAMRMKIDDMQKVAAEFTGLLDAPHAFTRFFFETPLGVCDGSTIYLSMAKGIPEMFQFDFERDTPALREQWTQELGAKLARLFPIFRGVDAKEPIRWRALQGEETGFPSSQGVLPIASALANQVCAELEANELSAVVRDARGKASATGVNGQDSATNEKGPQGLETTCADGEAPESEPARHRRAKSL